MGTIPKPQIPNSLYLCWRCMKRFEAPPKSRQMCPDKRCGKGGGIVSKIVETVSKEAK